MKITLNEITFTKEEMTSYLQKNGYKIELHNTWARTIIKKNDRTSFNTDKEYAIPLNEQFDVNQHKTIEKTFETLIQNGVKNFILSLVYVK